MKKILSSFNVALLLTLFLSTTASAHTGMKLSNITHSMLHLSVSIGTVIVLIIVGFYVNRFAKVKKIRITIKK